MKLMILKTKEIREVPDEYGARLIEQGQAVFAKEPEKKPEEKKEEKPKAKKG